VSIDDLLFIIIIGGMALSVAYLRAQCLMRRSYRLAERGREVRLRELYSTRPNTPGPLKDPGRPVCRAATSRISSNAVLHRSLPVQVRLVSTAQKGTYKSTSIARQ
jgi:hypothetical protein